MASSDATPDDSPAATVLVTGGSGLLGRAVCARLRADGYAVTGTSFSRTGEGLVQVDLTDGDALSNLVASVMPDVIVHCAAERRPDKCAEASAVQALNTDLPRALRSLCATHGSGLIYISTDYVFDGSDPPYTPDSTPNPLNVYGESKLAGERAVLEAGDGETSPPPVVVLRVPVLYGTVETLGESSVTSVVKKVIEGVASGADEIKLDNWAMRFPTHTGDVAGALSALVAKLIAKDAGAAGVFHFSGTEAMTKYEMGVAAAAALELDPTSLAGVDTPPDDGVPRPQNAQLDCSSLEALVGDLPRVAFADAIAGIVHAVNGGA